MSVPVSQMYTVASYVLKQKLRGRRRYPFGSPRIVVAALRRGRRATRSRASCGSWPFERIRGFLGSARIPNPDQWTRKVPGNEVAPGPGRLAAKLISTLLVDGMQKTAASVVAAGVPLVSGPAGEPFSVKLRQAALPKHPT